MAQDQYGQQNRPPFVTRRCRSVLRRQYHAITGKPCVSVFNLQSLFAHINAGGPQQRIALPDLQMKRLRSTRPDGSQALRGARVIPDAHGFNGLGYVACRVQRLTDPGYTCQRKQTFKNRDRLSVLQRQAVIGTYCAAHRDTKRPCFAIGGARFSRCNTRLSGWRPAEIRFS